MQKEIPQARKVRALLNEAAEALGAAQQALFRVEPGHAATLESSLRTLRKAFAAFITWHCLALPDDASLRALTQRAVPLASSLRTCARRALLVEALAETVEDKNLSRADREEIRAGYYTARNTFYAVFDELPAAVRPEPSVPRSEAFAH